MKKHHDRGNVWKWELIWAHCSRGLSSSQQQVAAGTEGLRAFPTSALKFYHSWSREHLVWVKLLAGYVCTGCAMPRGQQFTTLFPILQLWHSLPRLFFVCSKHDGCSGIWYMCSIDAVAPALSLVMSFCITHCSLCYEPSVARLRGAQIYRDEHKYLEGSLTAWQFSTTSVGWLPPYTVSPFSSSLCVCTRAVRLFFIKCIHWYFLKDSWHKNYIVGGITDFFNTL